MADLLSIEHIPELTLQDALFLRDSYHNTVDGDSPPHIANIKYMLRNKLSKPGRNKWEGAMDLVPQTFTTEAIFGVFRGIGLASVTYVSYYCL